MDWPGIARRLLAGNIASSRLQTQSGPPDYDGSDGDSSGEVCRELVVSSGNAAPVFEPAEHALDEIALLVGALVERVEVPARRIVGDHGQGAAIEQEAAQGIAVVGRVSDA